jgi:hypothetical protein
MDRAEDREGRGSATVVWGGDVGWDWRREGMVFNVFSYFDVENCQMRKTKPSALR